MIQSIYIHSETAGKSIFLAKKGKTNRKEELGSN